MSFTQDLFTSRRNIADGNSRLGDEGRIWYDSISNSLRIGDGGLTLFVGSNDSNLAKAAQSVNLTAYLINQNNQHQTHSGVAYTSISDLESLNDFASLLRQADSIIYVPAPDWILNQPAKQNSERYWIEQYLYIFSLDNTKKIINCPSLYLPTNDKLMLTLNAQRKNNDKHLWVSGCSTTLGDGVELHERYANILAEKLNLPLCMLAKTCASVAYSADQILRSDIQTGDLVIWGITVHNRKTRYDEKNSKLNHVTVQNVKDQNKKIDLTDPTLLYDSITAIYQVLNFCHKINAKLILVGIHSSDEFCAYLKDIPLYVHASGFHGVTKTDMFIDIGNDNMHPGPLMHQFYAEKILSKLKEIE